MKARESGMPAENYWESFFKASSIFSHLQLDNQIVDAAEFGSGYGTFTIPAAKFIRGNIYAIDIDDLMIKRLQKRISMENLVNVKVIKRDFIKDGTGLNDNSIDYVMMFNILHAEYPEVLLNESYRILKQNGKLGVIHWINSSETPRGPSLNIRPTPVQCSNWIKAANFQIISNEISLPPYHYGIWAIK
jgi:ubiquinone/menaquinone biosynthesis C-methylase UbiE